MLGNSFKLANVALLHQILPEDVFAVEQIGILSGALSPEEELALGSVVEKRRSEFAAGRACGREALAYLNIRGKSILPGQSREPLWPEDIVGSITHCNGYCAAAIASRDRFMSIGIDAEPNEKLPEEVLGSIALWDEIILLQQLPAGDVHWDKLLFSIKESVYKAWFPIANRWLDFKDARILINPQERTFKVELLARITDTPFNNTVIDGRYLMQDDLILSCICIPTNGRATEKA
ncbi:4'-phosphopantetheinyl transferase [Granulicella sp. L60]|uniref:4'-phosphopantetheinyl transferase family protein n=1 Tax=Granulicella sp. L60 TaxID=1641866 RepID=UPI0020B167F0|nr:4'-phosphopantetheinyl transferase superfamily protein [Granulicella sp. L60]